jgi:hypothetical protein
MRLPTKARSKSFLTTVIAGALLAGCAGETTAPAVKSAVAKQSRTSPFAPSAAAKALIGVADGTYEFTIDPSQDQAVNLGPNYLSIPANAVCDIANSTYGVEHWNESCEPQTEPVHITAIVRNATTDHPSIDFYPAMRFAPDKNVGLYIYVPSGLDDFQKNWVMKYCNDTGSCVDESVTDSDLKSFADTQNQVVFRRIKHFSGYLVNTGFAEEVEGMMGGLFN